MDADLIAWVVLTVCFLVVALIAWALYREETHDDGYYFEDSEGENDEHAEKPNKLP